MDDLAIAFAMRCDEQGLTYEAGVRAAADLVDEIEQAAEDRESFAPRERQVDA
jgi:hypothetical protein